MNRLSPEARRLVQLACHEDEPNPDQLSRIKRTLASRLVSGVGVATAASLLAKSAAGAGVFIGTTKLVSIAVIAGAVSAAGVWTLRATHSLAPIRVKSADVARHVGPSSPTNIPVSAPSSDIEANPLVDMATIARNPPANRSQVQASANVPVTPAGTGEPQDQLRAETSDLRAAQQAMRAGDAERALLLLNQQDATYQHGLLQEERSAARVLALCQNGQVNLARAEAARFEHRWPRSPLIARIRSSCF
jgi:hypothetical protein